ncbi:protein-L-isoaspartate O-methyltransferase family protein [Microvirga flavescens]|uniref:protein-L-isoaspartate O-methyltransferase family protein n=1 Tax=Microvirga flavescens TaxID=2249811 RepID=UPI000DD655BD|nr:protein-L-isoaspartate O-methyltransferase [Microvirga flavescens]
MVDFAQARRTMVDSQLRTFDVNDIPLLDAMDAVPRERFVPSGREDLAYIDQNIQVADGPEARFMLAPMVLGRMIQALDIESGTKVLDVACGRGYSSAILTRLGASVTALEADEGAASVARQALAAADVRNVDVTAGPLDKGHASGAPYDAILVNGSVGVKPEFLLQQLGQGGRLVCVQGQGGSAQATLYVRSGDAFGARTLFNAAAPALAAFQPKPGFVF